MTVEPDRAAAIEWRRRTGPARRRRPGGGQGPRGRPRRPAATPCPSTTGWRRGAGRLAERFGGPARVICLMTSGGIALWVAVLGTPLLIRWLAHERIGQQIREDGPPGPHRQGGHADDGRHRHRGRRGRRVSWSATSAPDVTFAGPGCWSCWPSSARGVIGLRRRLDQGPAPPEPRAQQAGQVRLAQIARRRWPSRWLAVHWAHASTTLSFTRCELARHRTSARSVGSSGPTFIIVGHGQRREPHRRPRRPGRRARPPSASPAWPSSGTGSSGTSPSTTCGDGPRPGPRRGGPGRGLPRLPVVERGAGPDLHGRHRVARHRRRAWPALCLLMNLDLLLPSSAGCSSS